MIDIEAIKARVAATPKNWRREICDHLYGYYTIQTDDGRVAEMWGDEARSIFVVNARNDIETLLAEIEHLRAERDFLREYFERAEAEKRLQGET